jgi:hypothetical protein
MPGLILDRRVQQGLPATVLFGPKNTAYSDTGFKTDVGLLRGKVSVKPSRKALELKAGSPITLQKSLTNEEGLAIEITCAERDLTLLNIAMGGGTLSTVEANATTSVTSSQITLNGTAYHALKGAPINAASVTVTSNDATPVSRNETTDYVIDYDAGYIKRVDGGNITDGDTVLVTYTWANPGGDKLTFGGDTSRDYYSMRIIFEKDDLDREILDIYKAYPASEPDVSYNDGDWNFLTFSMNASADSTRTKGDRLASWIDEHD